MGQVNRIVWKDGMDTHVHDPNKMSIIGNIRRNIQRRVNYYYRQKDVSKHFKMCIVI